MSSRAPTIFTPFTGYSLRIDPDANATLVEASSTATVLNEVVLSNTSNSIPVFVKIFNSPASGVTLGTTVPTIILRAPARGRLHVVIPTGVSLSTALTYAVVTTGGTAGTSSPPSAVSLLLSHSN